ncbi:unnamed protein product [Rhizophagus irregularis]|uniref:uncharacterized protein n=1 Tax=Rhizophagus irregularis TaxID=588596 RepID=UPI001C1AF112|nr:hypothetical protein OCT59_026496 [Rhizophagus irregularis]CAB4427083.1 unnamed protein product [Rhizophagus irregularis]
MYSTFNILNGDIDNLSTTFESSKKKPLKLKFLLEELSNFEQMKILLLSLYEEWKYPLCGLEDETYGHIQKIEIY